MRVVVVGAGLGGLAAALRLQALGHEVTVLEAGAAPGGRAGRLREGGYTWDTGPSLVTMPWVLEETFAAGGLDLRREVTLRRLDPMYRIRWRGREERLDFHADADRLAEEVARISPADARRVPELLAALEPIHRHAILDAGRRPFLDPGSFARLVPTMARLGALQPLHRFVAGFVRNPLVRQALSFHSLFIGGDPFRVPAIYGALIYLQVRDGGWYVDGGVGSLVDALARPLDVRLGARVEAIEWRGDRARAARLAGGERVPADVIVSNADVLLAHRLLGRPPPLRPPSPSMSAFLLYLGTDRPFPALLHHTLLVGAEYRRFIRGVTRGRRLPSTYSTYVHAPSRTEPAMAAGGGDSLAVLLPVPNLRAPIDWAREEERLRQALVADLESGFGLGGLGEAIRVERRMTPVDFARRLGAAWGNAFSVEPLLTRSAYFRQPNRDRRLTNLYYVGAGTHPGAGIPGVLLGAEITAGLVRADHPRPRASALRARAA